MEEPYFPAGSSGVTVSLKRPSSWMADGTDVFPMAPTNPRPPGWRLTQRWSSPEALEAGPLWAASGGRAGPCRPTHLGERVRERGRKGERRDEEMSKFRGKGIANKIVTFYLYKVYDTWCHLFEKFIHRPQTEHPRQGCIPVTFVFPTCDPRPGSAGPVSGYLMPSHCSQYIGFPDMLQADGLWVLKYQC